MPRIPNLTSRDETPEELREAYDEVAGKRGGGVSGPYGVLLHSPEVAIRGSHLGNYVRFNSRLTPMQRELTTLCIGRHMNADVIWAGHVRMGLDVGVRQEAIDAIAHRADVSNLTAEEREITQYVRELLETNHVSAATFEALRARHGNAGVVDLAGLMGYYLFVAVALNTFEVEAPADAARLP